MTSAFWDEGGFLLQEIVGSQVHICQALFQIQYVLLQPLFISKLKIVCNLVQDC